VGVNRLDDQDYPAVTMGQAAELLGVQPAFLRSLDAADVMQPMRSAGGHRRYSRRQLEFAARMRSLFDQGLTLDAAHRILRLEDELEAARRRIAELERQADDHQTIGTDQRAEQTIGTDQRAERGSAERDGQRTSG
jgi:MerR family transcriptional regulator, heat shock protein HspR